MKMQYQCEAIDKAVNLRLVKPFKLKANNSEEKSYINFL